MASTMTAFDIYFVKRILTGMSNPRMEKQNAPISPINGEIVGTATARTTAAVTRTVLKINDILLGEY